MRVADVMLLYDYNYWANGRILAAAADVPQERVTAPAKVASYGSLHGTIVHTLSAEWAWRMRIDERISPRAMLAEEEFADLGAIRARWGEEEEKMKAFLSRLSDADLDRVVSYQRTNGEPRENTLWHLLVHVVNHGTQTRSEAAMLLTEYGHSPGDLDLSLFLYQRAAAGS